MLAAIHGSGQSLVGNIRRVLSELHRSKRLGGAGSVDCMLVRLYEPILFRSLAAANAAVRRNSLQLLLDAFPLLVSQWLCPFLLLQQQCTAPGLLAYARLPCCIQLAVCRIMAPSWLHQVCFPASHDHQ